MSLDFINKDDLCVYSGCCCSYSLLYCDMPGCIGCSGNEECLCYGEEWCLDLSHPPILCEKKDGQCCQLGLYICGCYLKNPSTCIKSASHCCCTVGECSFPPESHVPCICANYGLMCAPKCGCCVKYSEVKK